MPDGRLITGHQGFWRSMARGKRKKPVSPADALDRLIGGETKKMRAVLPEGPPDSPVLPETCSGGATPSREVRVFAAIEDVNGICPESVPGSPGVSDDLESEIKLSILLRRRLAEKAPASMLTPGELSRGGATYAEVLSRVLVEKAADGNQFALEAVMDRVEGKPTKAVPNKADDSVLNEQLDAIGVAALNEMVAVTPDKDSDA